MKAFYLISSLLLVFILYATRIDISIKKLFSENICTEYSDSENTKNDMEEKGEQDGVEDDSEEFASLHQDHTLSLFQSKLNVVDARQKLLHQHFLVESPPPRI